MQTQIMEFRGQNHARRLCRTAKVGLLQAGKHGKIVMSNDSKFIMDSRILIASIRDHKLDTNEGKEDAVRIIQELAAEYNRINEHNLVLQVELAQCKKENMNDIEQQQLCRE